MTANAKQNTKEVSACYKHYVQLHRNTGEVLKTSLAGELGFMHSKRHASLADFELWADVLRARPEAQVLRTAVREYQFALLALVQGFYRHAFMALRLFLELSVQAVNLSASELQLRLWLSGTRDLNWNEMTAEDKGIFSVDFVRAFCPELADEARHHRSLALKLYRECSEYVHGNPDSQATLPNTMEFSEDVFRAWHLKSESAHLVIHFILAMRYLSSLTTEERNRLENVLIGELGNVKGVRCYFTDRTEC